MKKLKAAWKILNTPIYTGERLRDNLRALTAVALFTALMGFVLVVANVVTGQIPMLIPAIVTVLAGLACAYCAGVLKNRELAALIPTIFCIVAFTIYAVRGLGDGTAVLFALMAPLGLCYFVSVRNGIIVSVYFSIFFLLLFFTPLREKVAQYYSPSFMVRFPLIFVLMTGFTAISMIQYHRGILLENEYTERLNFEVEKQTAVAEARSRRIEQMSFQTIQTLANAIDAKDPYTKGHSTRVSQYSALIAQALGWDAERVNDLRYAAMLHDIGKIGVPDSILNNPKRLTDVEYDIIKSHTTMGGDILKNRIIINSAEDVARSHHERWDGRGYPLGLKGEEISEEARIVAIADAFDAMSSNRVYRKACDYEHIRSELQNGSGRQFDPKFVGVFIEIWDKGLLDSILKNETQEDAAGMEASSALLQEVMEAFLSQSAAEDIDVTTGIMSRSAGESAIAKTMQTEGGCFVFLDLDNLKTINDTNGHEAGDRALRLVGSTLTENSENALCCRLGGDEFLFFMKGVTRDEAEARVQKIVADFDRKKRADASIAIASLSAGLVMCSAQEPFSKVYNKADKALYHVKQNGKNGYSFYSEESETDDYRHPDVNRLVAGIHSSGNYEGAMDVDYRQFAKLYEYISNLKKRFSCPFQLITITLDADGAEPPLPDELERAMYYMEQSIRQTIRNVDVLTRYSRQCFLIILLGADEDGVKIAVDRIFRGYYKMNGSGAFSPTYTAADLSKPAEERNAAEDAAVSVGRD